MKKKLRLLILGLGLALVVSPVPAMAADVLQGVCQGNPSAAACQGNKDQPRDGNALYGPDGLLTRVARLIAVVVGIASVILIIISGLKYVTSSGDPNNVKSAKDTLTYAIVGIVVTLMAQSIVVFVLSKL